MPPLRSPLHQVRHLANRPIVANRQSRSPSLPRSTSARQCTTHLHPHTTAHPPADWPTVFQPFQRVPPSLVPHLVPWPVLPLAKCLRQSQDLAASALRRQNQSLPPSPPTLTTIQTLLQNPAASRFQTTPPLQPSSPFPDCQCVMAMLT